MHKKLLRDGSNSNIVILEGGKGLYLIQHRRIAVQTKPFHPIRYFFYAVYFKTLADLWKSRTEIAAVMNSVAQIVCQTPAVSGMIIRIYRNRELTAESRNFLIK